MTTVALRLRAVASRRAYRLRATRRVDDARPLERSARLAGFSGSDIDAVEALLGAALPSVFREYLATMGRSCGEKSCGGDRPMPGDSPSFRLNAERLLSDGGTAPRLPHAVVFLFRQGCAFAFLRAGSNHDGPVFTFSEGSASAERAALSLAAFVEAELAALERAHERALSSGGFFLTVHPDGSGRQENPSRNSGIRPSSCDDEFTDRAAREEPGPGRARLPTCLPDCAMWPAPGRRTFSRTPTRGACASRHRPPGSSPSGVGRTREAIERFGGRPGARVRRTAGAFGSRVASLTRPGSESSSSKSTLPPLDRREAARPRAPGHRIAEPRVPPVGGPRGSPSRRRVVLRA